jgi:hypothetical protein
MTPVTPAPAHHHPAPGNPGDELFWLLRRALHTMRRDVRERVDLTPSRHRLLRVVARAEPQRQTALAAALDVVPRSITSLVDDLERSGLVERRPDPTDRRGPPGGRTAPGPPRRGQGPAGGPGRGADRPGAAPAQAAGGARGCAALQA